MLLKCTHHRKICLLRGLWLASFQTEVTNDISSSFCQGNNSCIDVSTWQCWHNRCINNIQIPCIINSGKKKGGKKEVKQVYL